MPSCIIRLLLFGSAAVFLSVFVRLCYLSTFLLSMQDRFPREQNNILPMHDNCIQYNATHFNCLPNVYFIGASKAGTTTMVDYLNMHPDIEFVGRSKSKNNGKHKEVHRYDRSAYVNANKLLEFRDELESSPPIAEDRLYNTAIIHYTPHYLYAPAVPFLLRDMYDKTLPSVRSMGAWLSQLTSLRLPNLSGIEYSSGVKTNRSEAVGPVINLKFIIMLREPITRALSSYWFKNSYLFNDIDRGSYEEFIELANEQMQIRREYDECMAVRRNSSPTVDSGGGECQLTNNCNGTGTQSRYYKILTECFGKDIFQGKTLGFRHIDKGIYVDQLDRWFYNFPPTSPAACKEGDSSSNTGLSICSTYCIITLEDFTNNPVKEYAKVLKCIGIDVDSEGSKSVLDLLEKKQKLMNGASTDPQASPSSVSIAIKKNPLHNRESTAAERLRSPNQLGSGNISNFSQHASPQVWNSLLQFYKPYNKRLSDLLSIRFGIAVEYSSVD